MGAVRTAALLCTLALAACADESAPPPERPIEFGGARPVSLQVPTGFQEGQRYPLLLVLHGYSANGFLQQAYFRMGDLPDRGGVLVLAPDGTKDLDGNQFWNADPACCDFGSTGVDDVAYLGGLLDAVMAAWPVDPAQVTVLGHSNGGFMAYRLACERADVITAIAGLAGHATSTGAGCAPTRPVSVLHLHGDDDGVVPYETGAFMGVPSPGAVDSVAAWAARNGCTGTLAAAGRKDLESGLAGDETFVAVTGGCPTAGAAELWTMEGAGHVPALGPAFPTEIMAWFAAHRR